MTDLPADVLQDPTFVRTEGAEKGRDGCRVPLPWTETGESFGFGPGAASHLPQPEWFGAYAVERELSEPASTLHFYIDALAARRSLQGAEELSWRTSTADVVAFERPGGWVSMTNFGEHPVPMPEGRVVIASRAVDGLELPAETTVWLQTDGSVMDLRIFTEPQQGASYDDQLLAVARRTEELRLLGVLPLRPLPGHGRRRAARADRLVGDARGAGA